MNQVKTKEELRQIIEKQEIPLDTLDVSNITDMSFLFTGIYEINGDISSWDANERIINNSLLIVNEEKR